MKSKNTAATVSSSLKNKMLVTGTVLMLAAKSALGADDAYRPTELSLDGFGSASIGKYTIDHLSSARVRHNARLGAGLGLSYFFTRNVGIGADAYSENTTGPFVDR